MFFVVSLFLAVGVMAQIDTKKEYRIKSKDDGKYLTIGTSNEKTRTRFLHLLMPARVNIM